MTSRAHGLVISLALGAASAVAAYAVIVTGHVAGGTTKPELAAGQAIAARAQKLDAWEASLREALAARPPAIPTKARYGSVVIVSPPSAMALPALTAVRPRPVPKIVAVTVSHVAPERPRLEPVARPKAEASASPRNAAAGSGDGEQPVAAPVSAAPVTAAPVTAPPVAAAAGPAPVAVEAAPAAEAPVQSATASSEQSTSVEQQCYRILHAAENQGEAAKQAAEAQCEALKQASGTKDD